VVGGWAVSGVRDGGGLVSAGGFAAILRSAVAVYAGARASIDPVGSGAVGRRGCGIVRGVASERAISRAAAAVRRAPRGRLRSVAADGAGPGGIKRAALCDGAKVDSDCGAGRRR